MSLQKERHKMNKIFIVNTMANALCETKAFTDYGKASAFACCFALNNPASDCETAIIEHECKNEQEYYYYTKVIGE
jgi:hypothetical protein